MKRTSFTAFKELKALKEILRTRPCGCDARIIQHPGIETMGKVKTDEEIFREAMAGVKEIKEFRAIPFAKGPEIKPCTLPRDDTLEALREIVSGKRKIRLSDTGEYMDWTMPEMGEDIKKRLHHGDFSVQDCIDLHGMTVSEAEEALTHFFIEAVRKRLSCVKVIHGRGLRSPGGPVLKEALRKWLHGPFRKWTAAYATARDCDGGLGAVYIILKSR